MIAQVAAPICAGALMEHFSYMTLFPFCAVFVLLSLVTMLFVRHGDTKAAVKRGLEAFEDME
jgi:predicted MFS family arabinose efflux permease